MSSHQANLQCVRRIREFLPSARIASVASYPDEIAELFPPEVVELFTSRIRNHSVSLAPFEKIKRFTLVAKQFSQKTGEITPTLKVRRKVIAEKYRELIERMYVAAGSDQ